MNANKNPIIKPNKNNHPIVGKPDVESDNFWYCISSMCLGILLYVSNARIWYLSNTSLHFLSDLINLFYSIMDYIFL